MSLIHWWPLDGNSYDKIVGGVLSGTTTYQEGKLGKCSYNNSQLLADFTLEELDGLNKDFSMGCWIKINKQEILSHFSTISSSATVPTGSILGYNHYGGISLTWYADGLSNFNNISVRGSLRGTSPSYVFGGIYNLPFDSWTHLMLVKDTKNQKLILYIDGTQKASDSITVINSITNTAQNFGINRPSVYSGNGPQTTLPMRISDVRVYDHALSPSEVTELSKALVLHYTFDDELLKSTVDEAPNSGWSTYGSYWTLVERTGHGLKLQRPNTSTNTVVAVQNGTLQGKMAKDDIWTFSCYLYKDGQPYKSSCSEISSPTSYYYKTQSWESQDDGYYRNTFKITGTPGTWMLHNNFFGSAEIGPIYEMRYMKFEKGDYATPHSASWPAQTIINETGFIDTANQNDLIPSANSAQGKHSGYFNGKTSYVDIPITKSDMFTSDYTISFWVYPLDNGRAIYLGDYNDSTGLNFERVSGDAGTFRYYHNGNPNWYYDDAGAPVGQWTHLAITYSAPPSSGTTGELLIYKNGICINNNDNNTQKNHTSTITKTVGGKTRLGADYRSTSTTDSTPLQGYMDDFRYYATCLKKEDIEDLYRTKAYITDKSDIMCGGFIENKIDTMITEKSTFECKEIYEEIDPAYERLDYTDAPYNSSSVNTCPHIDTGIPSGTKIRRLETLHYLNSSKASQIMFGNNGFYCFYREWNDPRPNYGVIAGGSDYIQTSIVMQPALVYATCDIRADKTIELYVHQELPDGTVNEQTVTGTHNDTFATDAGNYYLFGYNLNGSRGYPTPCKMYMFKIYGENGLLRDFVPAKRKSDGTIGMYDSVTKGFFTNVGNGSFEAGDVKTSTDVIFQSSHDIGGREIIEI